MHREKRYLVRQTRQVQGRPLLTKQQLYGAKLTYLSITSHDLLKL